MEKNVRKKIEVVGAIVLSDGKVLAARRGDSPFQYVAHKYEFVGGKIEPGEDAPSALLRELSEELCVKAEIIRPFQTVTHEYPDFIITLRTYLCRFLGDFVNTEHEELRFIPVHELRTEEWAPADAPIVETLKHFVGDTEKQH